MNYTFFTQAQHISALSDWSQSVFITRFVIGALHLVLGHCKLLQVFDIFCLWKLIFEKRFIYSGRKKVPTLSSKKRSTFLLGTYVNWIDTEGGRPNERIHSSTCGSLLSIKKQVVRYVRHEYNCTLRWTDRLVPASRGASANANSGPLPWRTM